MVTVPAAGAPGDLIGREQEISELRLLASRKRLVTLCGAGGIGKTRLLQALLPLLASDYPDGTVLVRLADLAQPGLVADRMAAALGLSAEPGTELAETLTEAVRGRRMVLAVDGYEHVVGACADLCQRLLACAPELLLVTAARQPLRVPGEAIWQVPALGLPAAGEADPGAAARSGAVALFVRQAAAVAPGFALDADAAPAVVAACRTLGGLPLAIELAAARICGRDAGELAAQLAGRPELPGPGDHAVPAPYAATMGAALAWSWAALAPAEQVLLRRLSVSPGWTLEMAEQVCADARLPVTELPGLLAGLARKALIQAAPSRPGQGRCRIPGAVADYAAARCAEAGETELLGRRLRDYTAQRVEYVVTIVHSSVPVTAPVQSDVFRSYNDDARNVRIALTWCLNHGDIEAGLRICTRFTVCWHAAEASREGVFWLDALLGHPAAASLAPAARGPALSVRAQLACDIGDSEGALAWGAAALPVCQAARDRYFTAITRNVMSMSATAAGRPAEALRHAAQALELARQGHDRWNEFYALKNQADALAAGGQPAEARQPAGQALALSLRTDQHYGAALARLILGRVSQDLGELDAAREYYQAALASGRHMLYRAEVARCLADLGRVALRQGDAGQARTYLTESLTGSLAAGNRAGIARALLGFADLTAAEGSQGRAVRLAAAATALSAAARLPQPDEAARYRDEAAGPGGPQAARLWAEGLELSPRSAARLALDPPTMMPAAARQD